MMISKGPFVLFLLANLLIPIGCGIFMKGFFRGVERPDDLIITAEGENGMPVSFSDSPFDKVVFMMVDALRSDFVYTNDSGFAFTQSLIRSGSAIPFTALAAPPTLTLSRIKALTQGTSQSFLDSLLNVLHSDDARQLTGEDTWLSRMKAETNNSLKMAYYGCDMWTMLYPEIWDRFDIVDSLYLADFLSGDINITRHLHEELERDDWKALVLHYVGLDDVAHFGGAYGSHIKVKQTEMDQSVQRIYEAIKRRPSLQNTLLVLLGDHGMNERGNHGGDTHSEVSSAQVFISPHFRKISSGLRSPAPRSDTYEYYEVINQIDIVPTIAGLLGFTIPIHNVGIVIPQLIGIFGSHKQQAIRTMNAEQIWKVFQSKYSSTTLDIEHCGTDCDSCVNDESEVGCLWHIVNEERAKSDTSDGDTHEASKLAVEKFSRRAQHLLSKPLSNLSFPLLLWGVSCSALAMICLRIAYIYIDGPFASGNMRFETAIVLHASTMFVSQLVREEHHYWYWTSIAWLAYLGYKRSTTNSSLLFNAFPCALQFLSQCFNPVADVPLATMDFIHNALFDYPILLWSLGSMTYVAAAHSLCKSLGFSSTASKIAVLAFCFLGLVHKLCSTIFANPELFNFAPLWLEKIVFSADRNFSLRILWTGLIACAIYLAISPRARGVIGKKMTLMGMVELCNLYLRSQTRPKNLALYQIFDLQLRWLLDFQPQLTPADIALTVLLLGQSSFFAHGRDNQFSSFDMMNGYNGLYKTEDGSSYVVVTIQTLISNWLGPVWWSLAGLRLLLAWSESRDSTSHMDSAQASAKAVLNGNGNLNGHVERSSAPTSDLKHLGESNGTADPKINGSTEKRKAGLCAADNQSPHSSISVKKHAASMRQPFFEHLILQSISMATGSLAVMLSCIWLRDDPALWTALAPKFVNSALWVAFYHLMINIVVCGTIWTVTVIF